VDVEPWSLDSHTFKHSWGRYRTGNEGWGGGKNERDGGVTFLKEVQTVQTAYRRLMLNLCSLELVTNLTDVLSYMHNALT